MSLVVPVWGCFLYKTPIFRSKLCFFGRCMSVFLPVVILCSVWLCYFTPPSFPHNSTTPLSCIIFNWIILVVFRWSPTAVVVVMSCGVYAEGGTDHSGPFSVLTHARHWQIGAAGPEELGQICHTSQPQPGLMHIPSKCTRAIVNRVSLYHRGTMRGEILARSFLTNPKAFSDRVQMCVVLFVWWMLCRLLRLCNCAFTVLTRPPTTPQHQDSNLNLPKTWSLFFCCMHCTGVL